MKNTPPFLRLSICFWASSTFPLASFTPVVSTKPPPGMAPSEWRILAKCLATVVLPVHISKDIGLTHGRTYRFQDSPRRPFQVDPPWDRYLALGKCRFWIWCVILPLSLFPAQPFSWSHLYLCCTQEIHSSRSPNRSRQENCSLLARRGERYWY